MDITRLGLLAAAMYLMANLHKIGMPKWKCLQCGGITGHKPDCPSQRKPDA